MSEDLSDLELDAMLTALRNSEPPEKTPACPDEARWFEMAGGTISGEAANALLIHSSSCSYCAHLLNQAIDDFADQPKAGEDGVVTGQRFKDVVTRETRPRKRLPGWLPIAALFLLGLGLAVWRFWLPQYAENQAAALLAQAETKTRFSSFRFSGNAYAPTHVTRSQAADVPVAVLDAQQWIARAGTDAAANILKAKIAIATGEVAEAPAAIQKAMDQSGETPQLLNDLAAAWAARAERTRNDPSAGSALKAVDQALALSPNFPEALFNRALILNLLNRQAEACAALAAYRAAEKDSRWSEDASARIFCEK